MSLETVAAELNTLWQSESGRVRLRLDPTTRRLLVVANDAVVAQVQDVAGFKAAVSRGLALLGEGDSTADDKDEKRRLAAVLAGTATGRGERR